MRTACVLPIRCFSVVTFLLLASWGCEGPSEPETTGATLEKGANARIEIRGSDSEVNVVQRLAEAYMAEHPGARIAVTGGGSGTGISALLDGTIDIANSSRPLEPQERLRASRNDVEPVATVFATDALSVIVHPDNPVRSLTLAEIRAIFSGEATSWEAFGAEGEVTAYGRQPSSGTYVFFADTVVDGPFGDRVRQLSGSAQIVASVATDPGGIGYVAVGYLDSSKGTVEAVSVAPAEGADPVMPTDADAVKRGDYPIARPLFQYTDGVPTDAVRDFLRFELSEEGQRIATEMGFYPVMDRDAAANEHLQ